MSALLLLGCSPNLGRGEHRVSLSLARALPSAEEVPLVPKPPKGPSGVLQLPGESQEGGTSQCILFLQTHPWCRARRSGKCRWGSLERCIDFKKKKCLFIFFFSPPPLCVNTPGID